MQHKFPIIQHVKTHTIRHKKFTQESITLIINMQKVLKSFKFTLLNIS